LRAQAIFILHLLVKGNFRKNSKSNGVEMLQLDASSVFKYFEDNCLPSEARCLIAVVACGLLADMIGFDDKTSKFILAKFAGPSSAPALTKLVSLIDINSGGNRNEMRYLQGTNFGCAYSGFYD
jgi:hypothetical protein